MWVNFLVHSKQSFNTEGHVPADDLVFKPADKESYYCHFDCDSEHLKTDKGKPTFKEYDGPVRPHLGLVQFDFDSEDLQESLDDVWKFIKYFNLEHYVLCFSGSKGFHLGVPVGYFGDLDPVIMPRILRKIATNLKGRFPTIDTKVYNANRKFRCINSRHPKTGLYKILISRDSTLEGILRLANNPGYDYPNMPVCEENPKFLELRKQITVNLEISDKESGTADNPTRLEKFAYKKCIRALIDNRCPQGQRNDTALVIVNDCFKIGMHEEQCNKIMSRWAGMNGLPESEVNPMVRRIYSGQAYYNHGCLEPLKAQNCSAKCKLYCLLDVDKRPAAIDRSKKDLQEESEKPSEFDISRVLLQKFGCRFDDKSDYFSGGKILKQDKDLFVYREHVWDHVEPEETDRFKVNINKEYGRGESSSTVEKAFKTFCYYVPAKPKIVDMFRPNPYVAVFNNGTLHLVEDNEGVYTLDFRDHSPRDYATAKINGDYDPNLTEDNPEFYAMLDRMFEGDPDKDEKIDSLSEVFGACLMPAFPHIFFLQGHAKCGKSTLCEILSQLIDKKYRCSVQPHEFTGFDMETMAGTLVNIVTDIETTVAIKDSMIKMIEDRVPVKIRRKNIRDIYAPLPSIHVFGANKLPRTYEGGTKAMERRVTIIQFKHEIKGTYRRYFGNHVFKQNPQGVLNFAVKGLMKLVANGGIFTNPPTGQLAVQAWQEEYNVVRQFLDDIRNKEFEDVAYGDDQKIKKITLWNCFKEWFENSYGRNKSFRKGLFYKGLEGEGFETTTVSGYPFYCGIGLKT